MRVVPQVLDATTASAHLNTLAFWRSCNFTEGTVEDILACFFYTARSLSHNLSPSPSEKNKSL